MIITYIDYHGRRDKGIVFSLLTDLNFKRDLSRTTLSRDYDVMTVRS